jgi:hypothetical protein
MQIRQPDWVQTRCRWIIGLMVNPVDGWIMWTDGRKMEGLADVPLVYMMSQQRAKEIEIILLTSPPTCLDLRSVDGCCLCLPRLTHSCRPDGGEFLHPLENHGKCAMERSWMVCFLSSLLWFSPPEAMICKGRCLRRSKSTHGRSTGIAVSSMLMRQPRR